MPTPGAEPGKYEEAWAQWFLESSFFRDFVFRNQKGKGGKGELADAVVLYDDVAIMCQSKAVFSARDPRVTSPEAIRKALSQLKYTNRMLYGSHVPVLQSDTLGPLTFDPARYKNRFGLIILAAAGAPFDAEEVVPELGQMDFAIHVLSLEDFARVSTLFDTAGDLITYLEFRQIAAAQMRHMVHAEAISVREIALHIEDVLRAFDPTVESTVLRKTGTVFQKQAAGELLTSPEWRYGLLIDDLIARLHERDPELHWNEGASQEGTRRILEFLGWLTRYRRIQLGRRALQAVEAAGDGKVHYFAHYQRPRKATFVFLATKESRAERVQYLRYLVEKALARHGSRVAFGVATEPIGPGRSYDVFMIEADRTTEERAQILASGDPFGDSPESELE